MDWDVAPGNSSASGLGGAPLNRARLSSPMVYGLYCWVMESERLPCLIVLSLGDRRNENVVEVAVPPAFIFSSRRVARANSVRCRFQIQCNKGIERASADAAYLAVSQPSMWTLMVAATIGLQSVH